MRRKTKQITGLIIISIIFIMFCGFSSAQKKIYDNADVFTEQEEHDSGYFQSGKEFADQEVYYTNENNYPILNSLKNPFVCAGIAVIISGIVVLVMAHQTKSRMVTNESSYLDRNKYDMIVKNDQYIRTSVQSFKMSANNSRGGKSGGSSHRSSSGRRHGGAGRKF